MHPYENYDLRENDPYLIPGSECLKNLLGAKDTTRLNLLERQISGAMLVSLNQSPIPPTFDLEHLCKIHHRLFSRVYPFAGKVREVEIAKGGRLFLPHNLIYSVSEKTFAELKRENYLQGYDQDKFCQRVGYYFGCINTIHPFREGNGRTQRILIDQLAELNGYEINWSAMSGHAIAEASAAVLAGDKSGKGLARLVRINLSRI
ncbi:MAG: Fic/DOC family protein [Endozoicomonas sp.]|uniref:Fic/DOC family protein n=1 Tax=Endozoicomonas sp. TaxID=1892382 RepID=UPI003D9BB76C